MDPLLEWNILQFVFMQQLKHKSVDANVFMNIVRKFQTQGLINALQYVIVNIKFYSVLT